MDCTPGATRKDPEIDFGHGRIRSRRPHNTRGGQRAFEHVICVLPQAPGRSSRSSGTSRTVCFPLDPFAAYGASLATAGPSASPNAPPDTPEEPAVVSPEGAVDVDDAAADMDGSDGSFGGHSGDSAASRDELRARRTERSPPQLSSGGRGRKRMKPLFVRLRFSHPRLWRQASAIAIKPAEKEDGDDENDPDDGDDASDSDDGAAVGADDGTPCDGTPCTVEHEILRRGAYVLKVEKNVFSSELWRRRYIDACFRVKKLERRLAKEQAESINKRLDAMHRDMQEALVSAELDDSAEQREEIEKLTGQVQQLQSQISKLEMDAASVEVLGERAVSEVASSDDLRRSVRTTSGGGPSRESRNQSAEWRRRSEVDRKMLKDWEALHGGPDGLRWRLLLYIRTLGFEFWTALLVTSWFARFVHATIQKEARSQDNDVGAKIRSLVARLRCIGTSQRMWQRIHTARFEAYGGGVVRLSVGVLKTARQLMSRYMDDHAWAYIYSKDWMPRSYAGPEIAVKWKAELGEELAKEVAGMKVMMKSFKDYLRCVLRLLIEVRSEEPGRGLCGCMQLTDRVCIAFRSPCCVVSSFGFTTWWMGNVG